MTRIAVSPTKLDTWQDCPRRYWFRYVQKLRADGRWAHLSMGNAVHAALREWFELDAAKRRPSDSAELVSGAWTTAGFKDDEQSDRWLAISQQMVVAYLERHEPQPPHSTERSLGSLTDHATVSGRIDRIDFAPDDSDDPEATGYAGELVVVDYKTGKRVPTDSDARVSRALAIYCETVQRSLRRPAFTVQLHHVPTGRIASARHSPESLARQMARVDSLARDMSAAEASQDIEEFPPNPGPLCGWCDYREMCEAGGVVAAQPRWAGLQESEIDADEVPISAHDTQP